MPSDDSLLARGPSRVGRYVLHGAFASGGMAAVHFGQVVGDAGFSRAVTIKRLHPHIAAEPEVVSMLVAEARLVSRIRHPNVVDVLDVVNHGRDVLVVMEYVDGASLAELSRRAIRRSELVPVPIAASIAVQMLRGLHAAHEARDVEGRSLDIVHRDVSPQNVLVDTAGIVRVIDFGVAKASSVVPTTHGTSVKGKLAYMAPEQLFAQPVDRRADIFAAAVTVWETITGRRLFDASNEVLLISARASASTPEPPSAFAPNVSPALDDVVLKGLAYAAGSRYATAAEMADAIEAATPLADPKVVAGWVESLAGEALAERRALAAAAERGEAALVEAALPSWLGIEERPRMTATAPPPHQTETLVLAPGNDVQAKATAAFESSRMSMTPVTPDGVPRPGRRAPLVALAILLSIAIPGVALLVVRGGRSPASAGPSAERTSAPASSPSGAPPPTADLPPSAAAPTTSEAVATDSTNGAAAAAPSASASERAPTRRGPTRRAPASTSHTKGSPRKSDCDPPFELDARGVRHYKPECM